MKKRNHLYIERKHPVAWLTAALLLASAVVRICVFAGIDGVGPFECITYAREPLLHKAVPYHY